MHIFKTQVGGRTLTVEIGKLAKQASGSAFLRYGDTTILSTAVASAEPREGIDFFPLTVDYEERLYAVGKIPGGFIKREGRPSEKAVLSARLIDRPIRPLFPEGFRNDVQVINTVMSVEQDNAPEITAMLGASIALSISDIPFLGPIAGVIVGRVDKQLVINPTVEQAEKSDMHIVVVGTKEAVMMVEAGAKEVPEGEILEAIMFGHDEIKRLVAFIEGIQAEVGLPIRGQAVYDALKDDVTEKIAGILANQSPADWKAAFDEVLAALVQQANQQFSRKEITTVFNKILDSNLMNKIKPEVANFVNEDLEKAIRIFEKQERNNKLDFVKDLAQNHFVQIYPDFGKVVANAYGKLVKERVRRMIINESIRPDGRKPQEVRPVASEAGLLPRAHGSGLFTRGQTQVMTVATLGAVGDEQILDGLGIEESKRYMHHYNFPPYSVGEARPMRGASRRDIGHGALAERALEPMIPTELDFPYTIRLVSEVLESNGSSSMASVCGSTLALMDAGVPIARHVSGVAMGLIKEGDQVVVLTDIQGMEDALGDMDFKVAGTDRGVTAIQMDIKIGGIDRAILERALAQAYEGRMHIMSIMKEAVPAPRAELSPYAPRIISFSIDPDKIRTVIGAGGKTIKKIIDETGVKIDIEDDGRVFIAAVDMEAGQRALKMIQDLIEDVEVGKTYLGKVMRIMDFGAFVEVLPGKEGLVHISQLAEQRVNKVDDVVSVGDEIVVKVIKIDEQGRVNLSRKAVLQEQKQ
ncbi:MAG: polyribonucleotide nucleotidyltransferase [Clostridia bacterium]|nr:polyribonucleotide nucleotidyltransferase [Clostridia bacterium]